MPAINLHGGGVLISLSDSPSLRRSNVSVYKGKVVLDRDGEEIGKVRDILIDEAERKARFLEVSTGGFLGIGRERFLIPIDSVLSMYDDRITISEARSRLSDAPSFPSATVDERYLLETYAYYGKIPFWEQGYQYPAQPFL